jgi:hypothetical protein
VQILQRQIVLMTNQDNYYYYADEYLTCGTKNDNQIRKEWLDHCRELLCDKSRKDKLAEH